MAFYNPHKIEINPSAGVIGASGAMGRALYDIYMDNAKKNQAQMQIDERARHNQAIEGLTGAKMQADLENFDKELGFKEKKHNDDLFWEEKAFNANQAQRDFANDIAKQRLAMEKARFNLENQKILNANAPKPFNDYGNLYAAREAYKAAFGDKAYPVNFGDDYESELKYLGTMLKNKDLYAKAEQQAADPLKNLPVATQKAIANSRTALDMYIPYGEDLENNESQWSGGMDAFTAPLGQKLELGSDYLNRLYKQADAIAEHERSSTKGGAWRVKDDIKNQIAPGRTLANTTYSGVAANINRHLQLLKEQAATLKAQGNYRGAELLDGQYNDYMSRISPQIRAIINKSNAANVKLPSTERGESAQTQAIPQNIQAMTAELNNQNKKQKAPASRGIDYPDIDELGVLYQEW